MKGCLTLPFRILLLLVFAAGLVLAWNYRDEIRRKIHQWTADDTVRESEGRADPSLVPAVRRRVEELRTGRRDTLVLSAAEVASLVAAEVGRQVPGAMDSVEVRLGQDEVGVQGLIDTRRVKTPLGPAAPLLRDWERIEAAGRLTFRRAGTAEWEVERIRVRGLPVPRSLMTGMLRQLAGEGEAAGAVARIPLPAHLGGLRVTPVGLVLYGPNPQSR